MPELREHLPNVNDLLETIRRQRFLRPIDQTSSAERTGYAQTGLLTKEQIEKLTQMSEDDKEQQQGFTYLQDWMLPVSDDEPERPEIDLSDAGMPFGKATTPGITCFEWIDSLSQDVQDMMV